MKPQSETLRLLYEHSRNGPARQVSAGDAIDAKTFQLFAAATVVLGLGSFAAAHLTRWAAVFYLAAIAAYVLAGSSAWAILRARDYQVVDRGDRFWPSHRLAETDYVREQLLDDIGAATVHNHAVLDAKGEPLQVVRRYRCRGGLRRGLDDHRRRELEALGLGGGSGRGKPLVS